MRHYITSILFFIYSYISFAQTPPGINTLSYVPSELYLINPEEYLSKLDTNRIVSNVLIDRVFYDSDIFSYNGTSQVKTGEYHIWKKLYQSMKYSNYDTNYIANYDYVIQYSLDHYQASNIYTLGVLYYNFNRITQNAILSGYLAEQDSFLVETNDTSLIYSNHTLFTSTVLTNYLYGDSLTFLLDSSLFVSNVTDKTIFKIEVDFGNGQGYQDIVLGSTVKIGYSSSQLDILGKIKLTMLNNENEYEIYNSHFSFFRIASGQIEQPSVVAKMDGINPLSVSPPDRVIYYPGTTTTVTQTVCHPCGRFGTCCDKRQVIVQDVKIELYFLFSPHNSTYLSNPQTAKLRRPIIVCDGFDPGNRRDYYRNQIEYDSDLPRDNDFRGLYQLLNGDPSPWYNTSSSPNIIPSLLQKGYDVIFINFRLGDGNIFNNATYLRNVMKDVINSAQYRDKYTEEAIFIGPSMGGIISRMTLKTMENNNENHFVKLWVSFDSPQKGAYIPIGLQYSMLYLNHINTFSINALVDAQRSFNKAVNTLNTPAARQMLLYHFSTFGDEENVKSNYQSGTSNTSNHTSDYNSLYNNLNSLGYPLFAKNYSISNGGKQKLYENSGEEIVDFKIFNWTYVTANGNQNTSGTYKIFDGHRQDKIFDFEINDNDYALYTNGQISYDNAPGGFNSALYSLNCNPGNKNKKSESETEYTKCTFMVTTSALGIEVSRDNVFSTWEAYTSWDDNTSGKIKTPFDEIHGMDDNEEHVRISSSTASYFLESLENELEMTKRPGLRPQVANMQIKSGESVAFNAINKIDLGGDNNKMILDQGSNVTSTAEKSVTLLPGFVANKGSSFIAGISDVYYGKTSSYRPLALVDPVNYFQKSIHAGVTYNYLNNTIKGEENFNMIASLVNVYPNPTNKNFSISISDNTSFNFTLFDIIGNKVYESQLSVGINEIDISQLTAGVYVGFLQSNLTGTKKIKVIKQ